MGKCAIDAAVAVWGFDDAVIVIDDKLVIGIGDWDLILLDDEDLGEAEILMSVDEILGCLVIGVTGHDDPGDGSGVFDFCGSDFFCEELEEGFIFYGGDGDAAFWAFEVEACALAAGDS